MQPKDKQSKHSLWGCIKVSLSFYAIDYNYKHLLILIIWTFAICKNIAEGMIKDEQKRLGKENSTTSTILMKILIMKSTSLSMNFIADTLMEKQLIPYGPKLLRDVLSKLIQTRDYRYNAATGSHVEYYITEGSKNMAKICRIMLLDLISKIFHLITDMNYVYKYDTTNYKIITISVLIAFLIISVIRLIQSAKALKYLEETNNLAYQREKVYAESMDSMAVIKSYKYEEEMIQKYNQKSRGWIVAHLDYKYLTLASTLFYESSSYCIKIGIILMYLSFTEGDVMSKDILLMMAVIAEIIKTGSSFIKIYREVSEQGVIAHTVIEYLNEADPINTPRVTMEEFHDCIEVSNVTYSNRGRAIFSNVSFRLNKRDKAVLYGRNGIGKSSVFKLILDLDAFEGGITIDGVDVRTISLKSYRSLITFVPQDTKLFDESIYANLMYGNDKSCEEVVEECRRMRIHERIMALPRGYNTMVGEGGRSLNGGLRQKIYYTRAFLCDTPVYFFDEPTNNLDEENALFILDYINDAKFANKTFLVICHDPDIIERFPKIYKFEENKIILEKNEIK